MMRATAGIRRRLGALAASIAVVTSPEVAHAGGATSGGKNADPSGAGFVEKWNALGAGCPGREGGAQGPLPGAAMEHRGPTKEEPRTHVFRFKLPRQRVSSPRPTQEETRELAFGSECSIRMVLAPPPGARISGAFARSTYRLAKDGAAEAWILSDLQLGNRTIAKRRVDFPSGAPVSFRSEELALVPGRNAEESMPETRCGQARILGLDTLFAVKRASTRDRVDISLGDGGKVEIVVELAPC